MTASIRLLVSLIVLTAGFAGFGANPAGWWQSVVGQRRPADDRRTWLEVQPAEAFSRFTIRRIQMKTGLLDQMAGGELDLFEAAAWFRFLNSEPAEYPETSWWALPGDCDGEKLCRQVILWTRLRLEGVVSERQVKERVHQLEATLAAHKRRHGTVVLPDLSPAGVGP
ncbi:MAG: hypothetical protein U0736_00130 [Gemmataceae bacterium]